LLKENAMSKTTTTVARPAPKTPTTYRSRHAWLATLLPVTLVIVVITTLVVIKVTGGSGSPTAASAHTAATTNGTTALPAGVFSDVTSVSPSTWETVGRPAGLPLPVSVGGHPSLLTGTGGKPEVMYVGAEYCPYCAAQRWALVEALSHFGTFTNLSATHSSSTDVYPDTPTFSFYGSTYSSPYLDFVPVEQTTNQPNGQGGYVALQTLTAGQQRELASYDASPYTSAPGNIPFLSVGNHTLFIGASYNPQILQGLSMTAIARQLNDPTSQVALAIDGTANEITASICAVTGGQPAAVCNTAAVQSIEKAIGG
jgi:hypothetical protein